MLKWLCVNVIFSQEGLTEENGVGVAVVIIIIIIIIIIKYDEPADEPA